MKNEEIFIFRKTEDFDIFNSSFYTLTKKQHYRFSANYFLINLKYYTIDFETNSISNLNSNKFETFQKTRLFSFSFICSLKITVTVNLNLTDDVYNSLTLVYKTNQSLETSTLSRLTANLKIRKKIKNMKIFLILTFCKQIYS